MSKLKLRQSNMELLRILAMFLVMVVHASFLALGVPTTADCHSNLAGSVAIFMVQSISVVCVNVFVLLSGWFGVHFKTKKILGLFFQAFYFAALILIALLLVGPQENSMNISCLGTLLMLDGNDYWFIKAYIGLCFLSIFMNAFIEQANEIRLRWVVVLFFIFQTIYGWLSIDGTSWLAGGYSAVSFVGLYLLGRYVRLYRKNWADKEWYIYLTLFFSIAIFQGMLAESVTYMGLPIAGRLFTYTNPLVIIQSLSLLLLFNKIHIQCSWINWVAASCVAVYLLHANELVLRTYYAPFIHRLNENYSTLQFILLSFFFMVMIFAVAVLLDQPRKWIWTKISR